MLVGDFQHEVNFIHSTPGAAVHRNQPCGRASHSTPPWGWSIPLRVAPMFSVTATAGIGATHLQRWTGFIALIFIFLHIAHAAMALEPGGLVYTLLRHPAPNGQPLAHATTALALQHAPWVIAIYVTGALAVVYHWSNGLWTAAITWGLTLSAAAQRRWGYVCAGLGVALTVFSLGAVVGALRYEVSDNRTSSDPDNEKHPHGPAHHGGKAAH